MDSHEKKGSPGDGNSLKFLLALANRHEGETILHLLQQADLKVQDLATACEVEWPAAKKYIAAEKLGAKAWETCSKGLQRLKIDPSLVRPTFTVVPPAAPAEDLKPLLVKFEHSQLETLRHILKADLESQRSLIDAIDGILLWKKK